MLPPNIRSTFIYVYHEEMDEVVSWLKNTATALGFTSNLPPKLYVADPPPPFPIYYAPTSEYTSMATLIAKEGTTPPEIFEKLDRAISIREIWVKELKPRIRDSPHKKRGDQILMSFLGVLKKVRKILTPRPEVNTQAKKSKQRTAEEIPYEPAQTATAEHKLTADHEPTTKHDLTAEHELTTEHELTAEHEQAPSESHAVAETIEKPSSPAASSEGGLSSEASSGFATLIRSWSAPTSLRPWTDEDPSDTIERRLSAPGEINYQPPWRYHYKFTTSEESSLAAIPEEDQILSKQDNTSDTIEKPLSAAIPPLDQTLSEGDSSPDTTEGSSPAVISAQDQMSLKDDDISNPNEKSSPAATSEQDQIPPIDNNASDITNTDNTIKHPVSAATSPQGQKSQKNDDAADTIDDASSSVASAQDQISSEDDDGPNTTNTAKEQVTATTSSQIEAHLQENEAMNTSDNASSTASSAPEQILASGSTLRPPTPTREPPLRYIVEPMNNMAEDFIAIYLMLSDLKDLQAQVRRAWKDFKDGNILTSVHLVTASLITNSAVDIARGLEEQCYDNVLRQGGLGIVLFTLLKGESGLRGIDYDAKGPDDLFHFDVYDYAEEIFLVPYVLLGYLAVKLRKGEDDEFKAELTACPDPKSDRSTKDGRDRFIEDRAHLLQMFSEAVTLVKGLGHNPLEDEFTRMIRMLAHTFIPVMDARMLWMAFAAQLYLDIRNVLREDIERGWDQLLPYAKDKLRSVLNSPNIYDASKPGLFPRDYDIVEENKLLQDKVCARVLTDPVRKAAKLLKRNTMPTPFFYYRIHPWACGLWYYYIKQYLHVLGVSLANTSGSIMYCGHLYNAGRKEGFNPNWTDMDLMLRLRKPEMGQYPNRLDDHLRGFMMTMGEVASTTSLNPNISNTTPAGEQAETDPLLAYIKQFRQASLASALVSRPPVRLQYLLSAHDIYRKRFSIDGCAIIYESDVQAILENYHPKGWKIMFDKIPIADFLPALQAALQNEQVEFNIDYLALHHKCWSLLRTIRKECAEHFGYLFGPEYMDQNEGNQLPLLVGYVLNAAVKEPLGPFLRGTRMRSGRCKALPLKALAAVQRLVEEEVESQHEELADIVRKMEFESWLGAGREWTWTQPRPRL